MTTIEPQPVLPGPDCAAIAPLLPLLDSPDLSAEEATRARDHMQTCVWCKRERAAHAIVDVALRRQYGEPPESAAPFLTMESFVNTSDIRDRPGQRSTTYPDWPTDTSRAIPDRPRRSPGRLTGIAAVAAALLLVGLAATLFSVFSQGTHGPAQNGAPTATTMTHQPPTPLHLPAGANLLSLSMASPTDGWAVGIVGMGANSQILLLRYHGGQWTIWPGALPQLQLLLSADGLSMDSPTDGWMTGVGGMLHYTNGQWVAVAVPGVGAISKVQMVSPTDGWARAFIPFADQPSGETGPSGVYGMLRFTNGAWSVVPLPAALRGITDETRLDFSVTKSGECWLMYRDTSGGSTEILRYTGGSFQVAYTLSHVQGYHITMRTSENGWLTGINTSSNGLYHFDGSAWTKVAIPASFIGQSTSAYQIVISPSGEAWLLDSAENSSYFVRYRNSSWKVMQTPSNVTLITFALVADDEGWAIGTVGDHPALYHYQNGSWTQYPN